MTTVTLKATSPSGVSGQVTLGADMLTITRKGNQAASLDCLLLDDAFAYDDESDPNNPVQLRSDIEVHRNGQLRFWGKIVNSPRRGAAGEGILRIQALGLIDDLHKTLASIGGDRRFLKRSPTSAITQEVLTSLKPSGTPGTGEFLTSWGNVKFALYPPIASARWLAESLCNTTTLGANINNTDTTIICQLAHGGMKAEGFVKIGSEWIAYRGYDFVTGGAYRLRNAIRGVFGTTAASHTAGATITQRQTRLTADSDRAFLERRLFTIDGDLPAGTWVAVENPGSTWELDPELGLVTLSHDIFQPALPVSYDQVRLSCRVFDEDPTDPDIWTIKRLASAMLSESTANCGPGLTAGVDFVIDSALDELTVGLYLQEEVQYAMPGIQGLLDAYDLRRGQDEDPILFREDMTSRQLRMHFIAQTDVPTGTLYYVMEEEEDRSLEGVASAVEGVFEEAGSLNLASVDRTWAARVGVDTVGSNNVGILQWETSSGLGQFEWEKADPPGPQFLGHLFDGSLDEGFGMSFDAIPGTNVVPLHHWWTDTYDAIKVNEIIVVLDCSKDSAKDGVGSGRTPIEFNVFGVRAYTNSPSSTVKPTFNAGDVIPLSGKLHLSIKQGHTDTLTAIKLEADDIGEEIVGIFLRWDGVPFMHHDQIKVRELTVRGDRERTLTVRLSDTETDTETPEQLFAPDTKAKLESANDGRAIVKIVPLGEGISIPGATSLLQVALLQSIARTQVRSLVTDNPPATLFELGDTIAVPDLPEFGQGVLLEDAYVLDDGLETYRVRLLNFNAPLVGG